MHTYMFMMIGERFKFNNIICLFSVFANVFYIVNKNGHNLNIISYFNLLYKLYIASLSTVHLIIN